MTNKEKLLKANNLEGMEIDKIISQNHKYHDELALCRKEISHIEKALNIAPTAEFEAYYNEAERVKAEVKERLK